MKSRARDDGIAYLRKRRICGLVAVLRRLELLCGVEASAGRVRNAGGPLASREALSRAQCARTRARSPDRTGVA